MANTLNFGAAGKIGTFETPLQSVSDKLLQYGKILNERDDIASREKLAADRDAYQRSRDTLQDTRYEADKKQKADENSALANYANQSNIFQTGEALSNTQGKEISDMSNNLTSSGLSPDEITNKLNSRVNQMYSENKTNISNDPMAGLRMVKENVVIPQGVDPSKIIQINQNLEDKFMRMQEKKDDLEYRKLKDKEDASFRHQQLGMQQQQLNASLQERKDREKEKQDERVSILNARNARNDTINDPTSADINNTIVKKETGKIVIPEDKKGDYDSGINKSLYSDKNTTNLKRMEEIANSGVYTDAELNDPVKLQQILKEKYSEEYSSVPIVKTVANAYDSVNNLRDKTKEINEINKLYPFRNIITGITSQEKADEINKYNNERDIKLKEIDKKYSNMEKKDNTSDLAKRLKNDNTSKLNEIEKLSNENTKSFNEADKELKKTLGVKEVVDVKIPKETEQYRADLYDVMISKVKNPTVYDVERIGKTVDDMTLKYDNDKQNKEETQLKLRLKKIEKADKVTAEEVNTIKQDRSKIVDDLSKIKSGSAIKEDLLDDEGNDISKSKYIELLNEKLYDYDKKINSLLKITDEDIQSELKR